MGIVWVSYDISPSFKLLSQVTVRTGTFCDHRTRDSPISYSHRANVAKNQILRMAEFQCELNLWPRQIF